MESVLSWVVSPGWEFVTGGVGELEGLAIRAGECVGQRVESEITSKGESGDEFRRSDECMGGGVSIVSSSEVTVVGSDN